MMFYLAIILACGTGALLRYLLGGGVLNLNHATLPFGTLLVNVVGSFLIGYLSWSLVYRLHLSKETQVVLLTGFLGGFTTFSAFSLEVVKYFEDGHIARALVYISSSVVLSIGMCMLGLWLARQT